MTFEEVFSQLQAWGSARAREISAQSGAGENQFGVSLGNLRTLAKILKTDHDLALQLWATGNADARILATMIMDRRRLDLESAIDLLQPLVYSHVVDELVFNVLAAAPFAVELRERCLSASSEMAGRAGWALLVRATTRGEALDFDAILRALEAEMKQAPRYKQEMMNRCLVEIGIGRPELTQRCIDIGRRLGRLESTRDTKGCTSSFAPDWITAVVQRRRSGSR